MQAIKVYLASPTLFAIVRGLLNDRGYAWTNWGEYITIHATSQEVDKLLTEAYERNI